MVNCYVVAINTGAHMKITPAQFAAQAQLMDWIEAANFDRRDYECVMAAVPNYEGTELDHRLAMWDPENEQWTVFGANWHPQPTHIMRLPRLPKMSASEIKNAAKASIHSADKDRNQIAFEP